MVDYANPAGPHPAESRWLRGVRRATLFSLLWLLLSGGGVGSWIIGVPAIAASTALSLRLWPGPFISLRGLLLFLPWFARQSVAGAVDVAIRALRPDMPLYPGVIRQDLRLPAGAARVALANVISMLPGTLSADLEEDTVVVHALDTRQDLYAMVRDLEPRIAAVFDVTLTGATETDG
jgi:multicomponent Na+:H+ antiporter subunit E